MTMQDLQDTVSHLSRAELSAFSEWFDEFMADQWDCQIESDILAGKLDEAGERADADYDAGRCMPLP